MSSGLLTSNWRPQNFFDTTLSQDMTDSSLEAFLTTVPAYDEGTLVIDPESPTNREIIYYTSKTALKVNIPANGRGYDDTTAVVHTAGTRVIIAPIADWFNSLRTLFTTTPQGWTSVGATPNTVTYNGNRSHDLVFNSTNLTSTLSAGMRLRTTRTVAAPTQSTSLNGTTQYYSKSSPAGMTFTDDFTVSAWIKVSSYAAGGIATRFNNTSGWLFYLNANGQLIIQGDNAANTNYRRITSYQSVPLNKWVHVAAQLDMSAYTATPTTCYVMIDGVDVPGFLETSGTNPTALVQAGNLEIGSINAGNFFPGKIAQVAIYSAKVTQATIRASMNQTLAGTETSLISAYSFNNTINDLNTTNANNLTANGSAVATNADSPFGSQADGTVSSTLDYAIVQKVSFSTNTTVTVQVPEGCTIPTSGGVSSVVYSSNKAPYGMPTQKGKWAIYSKYKTISGTITSATYVQFPGMQIKLPTGEWKGGYDGSIGAYKGADVIAQGAWTLSTSTTAEINDELTGFVRAEGGSGTQSNFGPSFKAVPISTSTQTDYYLLGRCVQASGVIAWGDNQPFILYVENAYL